MASRNPALNDDIFKRETAASRGPIGANWGSPADELPPNVFGGGPGGNAGPASTLPPPPGRGPFDQPTAGSPYDTAPTGTSPVGTGETMRLNGTMSAAGILFAILAVAGVVGWNTVTETLVRTTSSGEKIIETSSPGWLLPVMLGAIAVAFVNAFKPKLARFLGPVYAVGMGLVVGAISHMYNAQWDGIVIQAVGLTAGVFVTMLILYATGTIRVTDRMRSVVMVATGAIALFYLVSIGLRLIFHTQAPLIWDSGPIGIGFSLLVVGVASFNLLLDFDFIERGVKMGAPRYMEWYGAFGLLVSLVWLYLEILRLLAKLRER